MHWASRKPTIDSTDVRKMLGLGPFDDSVLFSFGGHALTGISSKIWTNFENLQFFVLVPKEDCEKKQSSLPINVHLLPQEEWRPQKT